jgi:hypothetical protein
MTKRTQSEETAEPEQGERPRKSTRKPGPDKYYIYLEPEGEGEREFVTALPVNKDPELFIDRSEDCAPGSVFRIARQRSNGTLVSAYRYTKEEMPETTINLDPPEETDEVEFDEEESGATDPKTLAKLVAATVNATLEARERRERAAQQQPSALELMREMEEMAERKAERERQHREQIRAEIAAAMSQQNPANARPQLDEETTANLFFLKHTGALKEMFRGVRELIASPEQATQPQSWGEWLKDLAREAAPYVMPIAAPAIGGVISKVAAKVNPDVLAQRINEQQAAQPHGMYPNGAPPPNGMHPPAEMQAPAPQMIAAPQPAETAESAEPESDRLTFETLCENIKEDVLAGKSPKESVEDVVRFCAENSGDIPGILQLMAQPNQALIGLLSQVTNTNLTIIAGADKFATGLKEGVRKRLAPVQVQAAPVPTNGNGAHAPVSEAPSA